MRIAVTCDVEYSASPQKTRAVCNMDYLEYVGMAGAHPFAVAVEMNIEAIADEMDGLLLTGGRDISPLLYNSDLQQYGAKSCELTRDLFEKRLYQAFVMRGKPIFGICRGFQMLAIMLSENLDDVDKLRLSQDIRTNKDVHIQHAQGEAEIHGDNPVHRIINRGVMESMFGEVNVVNSFHHQGVCMDGKTTATSWIRQNESILGWSRSEDKARILEALIVRLNNGVKVGGVQWHPERLVNRPTYKDLQLKPFQYVMGMIDVNIPQVEPVRMHLPKHISTQPE